MKVFKTKEVKTPTRGTPQSAGIDIYIPDRLIVIDPKTKVETEHDSYIIEPGASAFIPTGLRVRTEPGHALVAFNKSGVAVGKSLLVGACVIDEDYQGEIHIDLKNVGQLPQELRPGDKIIQLVSLPVLYDDIELVSSESDLWGGEVTQRGNGGFGSTGNS